MKQEPTLYEREEKLRRRWEKAKNYITIHGANGFGEIVIALLPDGAFIKKTGDGRNKTHFAEIEKTRVQEILEGELQSVEVHMRALREQAAKLKKELAAL